MNSHRWDLERGSVSVYTLAVMAALLTVAMLTYEGAQQLRVARHTTAVAGEAARAASQELSTTAIDGQSTGVDTNRGAIAAREYLTDTGADGQVVIRGDKVQVTVTETWTGSVLGSRTFTDTATAQSERVMGGTEW